MVERIQRGVHTEVAQKNGIPVSFLTVDTAISYTLLA